MRLSDGVGVPVPSRRMRMLLRLDAELARGLAPEVDLVADERRELIRRAAHGLQGCARQLILDLGYRKRLRGFRVQALYDLVRRPARGEQAEPLRGIEAAESRVLECRDVRHRLEALLGREREDPDLSGLLLRHKRCRSQHGNLDMASDQVLHRLPPAAIRNAGQFDAGEAPQALGRKMLAGAFTGMRIREL